MLTSVTGRIVGKDRIGMARMNHMMATLTVQLVSSSLGLDGDLHIRSKPNLALIELGAHNLLPSAAERQENRHKARSAEAEYRDTEEGVESGGRSKVDAGEGALDDRLEDEAVQGHLGALGRLAEPLLAGKTAVTSETEDQQKLGIA